MAKYKIIKYGLKYHVIGYEGVKKPKGGGTPTYRDQCISSHWSLSKAEKKKLSYENSKLALSSKAEPVGWTLGKVFKELNIAVVLAVLAAVLIDLFIKFGGH